MKRCTALQASTLLLLGIASPSHASDVAGRTSTASFLVHPKGEPPEAVRRMLANASAPAAAASGYQASITGLGATPVAFLSEPARYFYDSQHGKRVSEGTAAPGPWKATSHRITSALSHADFLDGTYPLWSGSSPSMSYALSFDDLPSLPGFSGVAVYTATAGSVDLRWDRATDSSAGTFTFNVEVTPTPAQWGVGPDQPYTLQFDGVFVD
ncbi:hypothetical protein [Stenotrophomonas sp.]|uniref:hypothetical protein n=1 Tax=Stenotrophomonas sp. TaxID=69392 RepID=UPI00289BD980|nr:hypothetical protein [Stenotrophomonas sp.]